LGTTIGLRLFALGLEALGADRATTTVFVFAVASGDGRDFAVDGGGDAEGECDGGRGGATKTRGSFGAFFFSIVVVVVVVADGPALALAVAVTYTQCPVRKFEHLGHANHSRPRTRGMRGKEKANL
jgi:hypothetical protein